MHFYRDHIDSIPPTRAHDGDSGYDLYATEPVLVRPGEVITVPTGIHLALEDHEGGYIWGKSGRGAAGIIILGGVIDPGYVGEIKVTVANVNIIAVLLSICDPDWFRSHTHEEEIGRASVSIPYGKAIAQICFFANRAPVAMVEVSESEFRDRYSPRFSPGARADGGFGSTQS